MEKKTKLNSNFSNISYDELGVVLHFLPTKEIARLCIISKDFNHTSKNITNNHKDYSLYFNVPINMSEGELKNFLQNNKNIKKLDFGNWINNQTKNYEHYYEFTQNLESLFNDTQKEIVEQNKLILNILQACSENDICRLEELYFGDVQADFSNCDSYPELKFLTTLKIPNKTSYNISAKYLKSLVNKANNIEYLECHYKNYNEQKALLSIEGKNQIKHSINNLTTKSYSENIFETPKRNSL